MKKAGLCFLAVAVHGLVAAKQPSLTVYNGNYAVIREKIPLQLEKGLNPEIEFTRATRMLEPDSVMLRDPSGKTAFKVVEQSYRNDPVSEGMLLEHFKGQTIRFERSYADSLEYVSGKIIRSGWTPGSRNYEQPVIETDGELRFSLPGKPLFPALGDSAILEPTLAWDIWSPRKAELTAELSYLSDGLNWDAAYNMVLPENGSKAALSGWITLVNKCGQTFEEADVKLMAGDVQKLQNRRPQLMKAREAAFDMFGDAAPEVTQKSFDDFHLYTLPLKVTLHDQETKQIEFVRSQAVNIRTVYVYDGADIGSHHGYVGDNRNFGKECSTKVKIRREFKNEKKNGLGVPLPKGRVRFYRGDDADGQVEFIGEAEIDHTPEDEEIRLVTGNAFDLVGERKQTDYRLNSRARELYETFEIKLRNRKKTDVEIEVVEHLYRWPNAEITENSLPFEKHDSKTVRFRVPVKAGEETVLTYTVFYRW